MADEKPPQKNPVASRAGRWMLRIMFKPLFSGMLAVGLSIGWVSGQEKTADTRVFELRTYHAMPGKLDGLLSRFQNHTTGLFAKHGMTNVAYWVPVDNKDNVLIYLLAYPDRASRDASWMAFGSDPEWKKVAADSEKDGKLVGKVDQLFLSATAFSPGFGVASGDAERLFEMRTYTTPPGGLAALHKRFSEHTIGLFARHGMGNLGYFQLVAGQPSAGETLLYLLAHKDADAAAKSWDAFRKDPEWLAVKKASEDAAGGSLTVQDGVKSVFMKPTVFSPLK